MDAACSTSLWQRLVFVCIRIEVVRLEWLATPFAIAVHLSHQCHDRARDIPVVLSFGFSHQYELAKC